MTDRPDSGRPSNDGRGQADLGSQIEQLTLTVAHLAAQLTMTQIRLRGLATALEAQDSVAEPDVRRHVLAIADREAGFYLQENLGDNLAARIEIEPLARQIVEFLGGEA
jgi:hypothetical protein